MREKPRIFTGAAMTLIGRGERYSLADAHQHIPAQWAWFAPRIPTIAGRIGADTFGLCSGGDDQSMGYFCGIRRLPNAETPADLALVHVPALRYAAFAHRGPVSTLSQTIVAALGEWLPAEGLSLYREPGIPDLVECYGADSNPQSGLGAIDIWVPIGS